MVQERNTMTNTSDTELGERRFVQMGKCIFRDVPLNKCSSVRCCDSIVGGAMGMEERFPLCVGSQRHVEVDTLGRRRFLHGVRSARPTNYSQLQLSYILEMSVLPEKFFEIFC